MKVTQIHDFGHKTSLNCKEKGYSMFLHDYCTGKYLSEALILASTNPQYDDRLFIELRVQYMKIPSSEHEFSECQNKNEKQFVYTTCSELGIFMY